MNPAKRQKSDSTVQKNLEIFIFQEIEQRLNAHSLQSSPVVHFKSMPEVIIRPDFFSEEERIIGEIHAHLGKMKAGQRQKIATDILKMISYEKDYNDSERPFRKYIVVCSREEADSLAGNSYLSFVISQNNIKVICLDLDDEQKNNLKTAMRDQNLLNENRDSEHLDGQFLFAIRDYLKSKGLEYNTPLIDQIRQRAAGKIYSFEDHIRGMVYSLLTNQTKWYRIEPKLCEIDRIFFHYDPEKLLHANPEELWNGLFRLKCGNMRTKVQMQAIHNNIIVFQKIEAEYGSIDAFIDSRPVEVIVELLSDNTSEYKLKMMGEALVWEYLRNVGVDGAKPDTHLRRFFGADRMGSGKISPAVVSDVYRQVEQLSQATGLLKVEIDNLIWSYCADGYGAVCTANPCCEKCVISDRCHGK